MFFVIIFYFFFFKQKTAYEMRISDWSSDVCSSDLRRVLTLDKRTELSGDPADRHNHRFARCARTDMDLNAISNGEDFRREHGITRTRSNDRPLFHDHHMIGNAGGQSEVMQYDDNACSIQRKIGRASGRERVCQYV